MPINKTPMAFLAWLFISFAPVFAQGDQRLADLIADHPSVLLNALEDYELLRLDDQTRADAAMAARNQQPVYLDLAEGAIAFSLSPLELRAPNYQRITTNGERYAPMNPTNQFRGTVAEGETAIFTIAPTFLMGQWELDGETYLLEPLWRSAPEAPRDVYVRYRASDLLLPVTECGVNKNASEPAGQGTFGPDKSNPGFQEVDIAVVVDSLLYQEFAGDEEVEDYVLTLLALVQNDYDKGFDERVKFRLSTLLLSRGEMPEGWSGETDSEELLLNFINFSNSPDFEEDYDVATLMTGRDLDGTVIGKAVIDAMCGRNRYNLVEDYFPTLTGQRLIWSHELGHNFGARHVTGDGFIMLPGADRNNDQWAPSTVNRIKGTLNRYTCLERFGWQYLQLNTTTQGVSLNWQFADDSPHNGFLIQRALGPDGPWTDVTVVPDASTDEFREADTGVDFGKTSFYRVIQFATDGTPCISETKEINVPFFDGGRLSPNPTFDRVQVYLREIIPRDYTMYDAVGRLLWRGTIEQGFNLIDLSHLSAGVYIFVEESPRGELTVERIVRQ